MAFPLAPWHLWGTSVPVTATFTAIPTVPTQVSAQLAKVNYGRPDTWSFLFRAKVLTVPAGFVGLSVNVFYDLIIGIGRSQAIIEGFAGFDFSGTSAALAGAAKWTSVTRTPELIDPGPSFRPTVFDFPAQDIQCSARVQAFQGGGGGAVGQKATVQVDAYFAPRTHIRPEWFTDGQGDDARYRGKEQGGT